MSDAPATGAPAGETPSTNPAPEGASAPAETPPWADGDFNAEKAWNLIQNLKKDKAALAATPRITAEQTAALAEYEQLRQANLSESQRQAEEVARWQADAERWRGQAVSSRIQALAAEFADPSDAIGALDPSKYLDAGGQIDEAAIKADLADVLARKPHWRRSSEGSPAPRVPVPNPAQGAGGGNPASSGSSAADQFAATLQGLIRGR